jgi:hypothetical protein
MPGRVRRPLDGWSPLVILSSTILLALPVIVSVTAPNVIGDTAPVVVVLGTTLAALVFLLSAAQRAHEDALKAVLSELEVREQGLFALAGMGDPEPWPEQAEAELAHTQTVAGVAALAPEDRRWRRKALARRKRAHDAALAIKWAGDIKVREVLGPDDDSDAQSLSDRALTPGSEDTLTDSVRKCWDWGYKQRSTAPNWPIAALWMKSTFAFARVLGQPGHVAARG